MKTDWLEVFALSLPPTCPRAASSLRGSKYAFLPPSTSRPINTVSDRSKASYVTLGGPRRGSVQIYPSRERLWWCWKRISFVRLNQFHPPMLPHDCSICSIILLPYTYGTRTNSTVHQSHTISWYLLGYPSHEIHLPFLDLASWTGFLHLYFMIATFRFSWLFYFIGIHWKTSGFYAWISFTTDIPVVVNIEAADREFSTWFFAGMFSQ